MTALESPVEKPRHGLMDQPYQRPDYLESEIATGVPPVSCYDQPEVLAAREYFNTCAPTVGIMAVSGESRAAGEAFDSRGVAEMKQGRLRSIFSQLNQALQRPIFTGRIAKDDYGVDKIEKRAKSAESIIRKLDKRISEAWASTEPQDPDRVMSDVYAFQVIVRDMGPDGQPHTEEDVWAMLDYLRGHFGVPEMGLDGEPTLRSARNANSAEQYYDQKAVLYTLVAGHVVPFEVQIFTESGYKLYKRTRPTFERNRKAAR